MRAWDVVDSARGDLVMVDKKEASKGKKAKERGKRKKAERKERRFAAERSNAAIFTMAGAIAGGLAVGAGAYGQWISDPRIAVSPWLVAGGAVILAAVILWGDMEGFAMRVGDAGVGVERHGKPPSRIAWCDMRSVVVQHGAVRIDADNGMVFKISSNPLAAAWVVKEAEDRIPKRLEVDKESRALLPETGSDDGERVVVEPLQVTGKTCRASGQVITFERDARFCPRCGEVYHKNSMPASCLTCEADLRDAYSADDVGTR